MRVITRLFSVGLVLSQLALPWHALAEDAAEADPFRPVQPSWEEAEKGTAPKSESPAPRPAPARGDNEEFLFDDAEQAPAAAPGTEDPTSVAEAEAEPTPPETSAPMPAPASEVDLHAPHVWMASGAIVLGVSFLAALAIATQFDEPGLAGLTLAAGGLLGIAGLTVGVVTQNQRLAAAGQPAKPSLPSGLTLELSFSH